MQKVQGPANLDHLNILRTIGPSPQLYNGVYWAIRSENIIGCPLLSGRDKTVLVFPSSALLSSHTCTSPSLSFSPPMFNSFRLSLSSSPLCSTLIMH